MYGVGVNASRKEFLLADLDDTRRLAHLVSSCVAAGDFVALSGELGAGKTQFVRELVRAMGSAERVTSPTFALINEYAAGSTVVRHVDAYRLDAAHEAEERGLAELLVDPMALVVCEWPERIVELVPKGALWLQLSRIDEGTEPGIDEGPDQLDGELRRRVAIWGPSERVERIAAEFTAVGGAQVAP